MIERVFAILWQGNQQQFKTWLLLSITLLVVMIWITMECTLHQVVNPLLSYLQVVACPLVLCQDYHSICPNLSSNLPWICHQVYTQVLCLKTMLQAPSVSNNHPQFLVLLAITTHNTIQINLKILAPGNPLQVIISMIFKPS